jgi:hypothetical protein
LVFLVEVLELMSIGILIVAVDRQNVVTMKQEEK